MSIKNGKFVCDRCGNCCRVFSPLYFGGQICPLFDQKTNLCKNYERRPVFCRTEYGLAAYGPEPQQRFCELCQEIEELRKMRDELEKHKKAEIPGNRVPGQMGEHPERDTSEKEETG